MLLSPTFALMMKVMAYILSLYIVLMNCMPCSDWEHEDDHNSQSNVLVEIIDLQGESDCPDDDCSPFCICECCHIQMHVYQFEVQIPEMPILELSTDQCFYLQNTSSLYLAGFLDPPEYLAV